MVTLVKQNYEENIKLYNIIEEKLRKDLDISDSITHVGSTAIPNMCGKNIIDILIGVEDITQMEEFTNILVNKGFTPSMKSKTDVYQFLASKNTETGSGDIHIHLVIKNTDRYNEFIILKEYLLANKEEAQNYSDFKRVIVEKGIIERKEYKAVKSEYVTNLIGRAKEWYSKK